MDYEGSNSQNNLKGNYKETYAKDVSYNIPGGKFKKLRKALKGKKDGKNR